MRIIVFDFDGTLSDSEMMVLLGKKNGTVDKIADITERAMNDEMSYAESFRSRTRLLEGLEEELAEEVYGEVELRPGAADLIQRLHDCGHHVAIFTGGFERGVGRALEKGGVEVDNIVSNHLPVKDGRLTGDVGGSLVEGTKDTALETHVAELDIPIDRTVVVGDGASDLLMSEVAGLSADFVLRDAVRPACDAVVASTDRLGKLFEGHGILDADE